jgi:hypothetical protein
MKLQPLVVDWDESVHDGTVPAPIPRPSRFDIVPCAGRARCLVFMKPYCLDIDTDYLVIPRVISGGTDEHPALPWCWPEELVAKLGARQILFWQSGKRGCIL